MSTPDQITQGEFERIIEKLDQPMRRLNGILFEVLEHIGRKLSNSESISMANISAMFRVVASHVSFDDVDRGIAYDYLSGFRNNFRLLATSQRDLRSPDLIEGYRHYSSTAELFARSLAYHVEGKPLFRLPGYAHFDKPIQNHMDWTRDLYLAARVL
jgi:hypothetical protein